MPNLHQIHILLLSHKYPKHCKKLLQIRCHIGAGTKMHKCLVGMNDYSHFINIAKKQYEKGYNHIKLILNTQLLHYNILFIVP